MVKVDYIGEVEINEKQFIGSNLFCLSVDDLMSTSQARSVLFGNICSSILNKMRVGSALFMFKSLGLFRSFIFNSRAYNFADRPLWVFRVHFKSGSSSLESYTLQTSKKYCDPKLRVFWWLCNEMDWKCSWTVAVQ